MTGSHFVFLGDGKGYTQFGGNGSLGFVGQVVVVHQVVEEVRQGRQGFNKGIVPGVLGKMQGNAVGFQDVLTNNGV